MWSTNFKVVKTKDKTVARCTLCKFDISLSNMGSSAWDDHARGKKHSKKVKGATKLFFMYYFRVVIILFSTGLYKSAFSTYDFGKTSFSSFYVLVFRVSVSLGFNF